MDAQECRLAPPPRQHRSSLQADTSSMADNAGSSASPAMRCLSRSEPGVPSSDVACRHATVRNRATSCHNGRRASASTETNHARPPRRPEGRLPPTRSSDRAACSSHHCSPRARDSGIDAARVPQLSDQAILLPRLPPTRSSGRTACSSHHCSPHARDSGDDAARVPRLSDQAILLSRLPPTRLSDRSGSSSPHVSPRAQHASGTAGDACVPRRPAGITRTPSERLISQIKKCATGDGLLALVEDQNMRRAFGAVHAASALNHAVSLAERGASMESKDVTQLVSVVRHHLQQMTPRQLANTMWALARLGHADVVFMGELVQAATPHLGSFTAHEAALSSWALTTLGHADLFLSA